MLDAIVRDLADHPGIVYLAISAGIVAGLWMWYTYKTNQEEIDLEYAQLDLQFRILEALEK